MFIEYKNYLRKTLIKSQFYLMNFQNTMKYAQIIENYILFEIYEF